MAVNPEKIVSNEIARVLIFPAADKVEVFMKGRMELVNEHPFFLIDGAHNAHGVHALKCSLQKLYPNQKFHFILD